ncbi:hypothetical protein HUG10_17060 [Halorarum halophilum]|uniref:Uncharacterized protein n=1 Tax=Halorarum halophilum TaxID=2743090 RepID=A0A7D5K9I8_9EURY|nr:hypothetical protein [Halobaculum halophilum]QLG29134.1 hypothetical protein HUG10_17060 [Halobaculum halophilum]
MRLRRAAALLALSTVVGVAFTLLGFASAALLDRVRDGLRCAKRGARDVPLSPLTAGWRVGRNWPERAGVTTDTEPAGETGDSSRHSVVGEMDDLAAYARPGFDPARVAPLVREFYERTAEFDMEYDVRWHAPFRLGAALASPLTARLRQLNLPGRSTTGGRLHSRFVEVRPETDPRDGARAWVRTDDEGRAVFVAVYASHVRDGERFVNIAVPLPFGNLSTVLRIDHHEDPDRRSPGDGGTGVRLHTDGSGDPGLYLRTPVGAFELPMDQAFTVGVAPGDEGADLLAAHEMWLLGRQFLTVRYRLFANASGS